jgi:hypothetical protein
VIADILLMENFGMHCKKCYQFICILDEDITWKYAVHKNYTKFNF